MKPEVEEARAREWLRTAECPLCGDSVKLLPSGYYCANKDCQFCTPLNIDVWLAAYTAHLREQLDETAYQLKELKRGLRNNNTDFELAFLDAYLDRFRALTGQSATASAENARLREERDGLRRECKYANEQAALAAKDRLEYEQELEEAERRLATLATAVQQELVSMKACLVQFRANLTNSEPGRDAIAEHAARRIENLEAALPPPSQTGERG